MASSRCRRHRCSASNSTAPRSSATRRREGYAMKISHCQSQILVLPESDPLANSPENPSAARPIVILRIGTDDGVEGLGVTFYGGAATRSLKAAVDDLGALTIGENPLRL